MWRMTLDFKPFCGIIKRYILLLGLFMSWIDNTLNSITSVFKKNEQSKHEIPEGVWTKCEACDQVLYRAELERNLNVCPKCGHHMRIKARTRLDTFLDANDRQELGAGLEPQDVLRFKDLKRYGERIQQAQKNTNEKDALVVEKGTLKGIPVVVCAFEFSFMGGSMGSVVGARFCLAAKTCLEENRALVCFATSGGARMQESLLSLMQMAKTSAVLAKLAKAHLPFISVMSDPTMGGVSASLAMLGDINIAEPNALIGFAGPRVIEQTVRETLPEGFQRAEFLLNKGAIDMIVKRGDMRNEIAELLSKMMNYTKRGDVYYPAGSPAANPVAAVEGEVVVDKTPKRSRKSAAAAVEETEVKVEVALEETDEKIAQPETIAELEDKVEVVQEKSEKAKSTTRKRSKKTVEPTA